MFLLSVIIPVYNTEKYLKECLDSVINQTYKNLEIICVNDGSTDNSLNILKEYALLDNRIKVINQENKGQSTARNVGLKAVKGEFVTFIDSDDYVDLTTYELALQNINDVDIVCFGIEVFGDSSFSVRDSDKEYYRIKHINQQELNNKIRKDVDVSVCNKIFKRKIIDHFEILFPEGIHYEDAEFYWKYIICSQKAFFINKYLYHYRRRSDSIMHQTFNNCDFAIEHLYIIDNLYMYLNKIKNFKANEQLFIELFKDFFGFAFHNTPKKNKNEVLGLANIYATKFYPQKNVKSNFIIALKKTKYDNIWEPDLNFLQKIFSVKKVYMPCLNLTRKNIYFLGFKFKRINKIKELYAKLVEMENKINDFQDREKRQEEKIKILNNAIFDIFQNSIIEKRISKKFDLQKYFDEIKKTPEYLCVDSSHNYLNMLLNIPSFSFKKTTFNNDKTIISWEIAKWQENIDTIIQAIQQNKNVLFVGDGFLRSINTIASKNTIEQYRKGISFTFDDLTPYYDATHPSRMELLLNDKNLILANEQKQRAKICIDKIIKNHLTKYNHQPIYDPKIGRNGVEKVLVVDQSYGDMSIKKGWGSDETFEKMLKFAIDENPNADIIVKTHPDTMSGNRGGYYTGLKQENNICTQTEPINPISLIKYVDKVYVCTTQFGFEALMCGKEVHVFGMPFYAGWGLTNDRQTCERRTNTRTLEEVFYIAYIMYSYYVNPDKQCRCEIEEAMDYLLNLREEYLNEKE